MKKLLLLLLMLGAPLVHAQIGMQISTPHSRYLVYEKIPIKLTLRNYSGNTLVFTKENKGSLSFMVRTRSGSSVVQIDPSANPMEGMIFAPGESKTLNLIINQLFDLQRPTFYNITACVNHPRLPNTYVSKELSFEVKQGAVLSSRIIGLPTAKESDPIHSITASIVRFNNGKEELYCLRIDDDEQVYGTFRIGPFMNGTPPQLDADSTSAIHVLVQLRPKLFSYTVYAILNGEAVIRQQRYYIPNGGTPQLSRASGYIKVLYATQAIEGRDFIMQPEESR